LHPLSAVSNNILVDIAAFVIVGLALTACGGKEALLALASAAYAWRVVRIVDATQVTTYFATAAGNACLVHTLVLRILG
jgi:hypothetical protein